MRWQFLKNVFGNLACNVQQVFCASVVQSFVVFKHCQTAETPWFALLHLELSWHWRIQCPTTLNLRPLEWWPGLKILLLKVFMCGTIWKLKTSNLQNCILVLNLYSTVVEIQRNQ